VPILFTVEQDRRTAPARLRTRLVADGWPARALLKALAISGDGTRVLANGTESATGNDTHAATLTLERLR